MSRRFLVFCTFIGLIVLLFRNYYMLISEINVFRGIIIFFITSILLLTRASNILTMFIGWEGVGVASVILIGWFFSREKANSAAYYALIFNRVSDFFFLYLVLWEVRNQQSFFTTLGDGNSTFKITSLSWTLLGAISLSIWMSTSGKSAQFAFHPWLTLAIEGPTPVSSLLHSSTIVVAGVYLLLKLHPILVSNQLVHLNAILLFSSSVSLVATSLWAINQVDLKKIIALSTTRQLRLIIIMCCFGYSDLAFLHILLHGFFKALLFLGRGVIIHTSPTKSQTLIGTGLIIKDSPFLHLIFFGGLLGLVGAPFWGSFVSKHLILDGVQFSDSSTFLSLSSNSTASSISIVSHLILYLSPFLTICYSLKLIKCTVWNFRLPLVSTTYIRSEGQILTLLLPLRLLSLSTLIVGHFLGNILRRGSISLLSEDDPLFSLFLLNLFIASIFTIYQPQRSLLFRFNKSRDILKASRLWLLNFIKLALYATIEQIVLKKGLKSFIPIYNLRLSLVRSLHYCKDLKFFMRSSLLRLALMMILVFPYTLLIYL